MGCVLKVTEDQIFNLIDTNGRRRDMINSYQIYAEELQKLNLSSYNKWSSWPKSTNQFSFYKKVLERSKDVFKKHEGYDRFCHILNNNATFKEGFFNLDKSLANYHKEIFDDLDKNIEKRARHYTNNLVKIGFITENRIFTECGSAFLSPEKIVRDSLEKYFPISDTSLLFFRQAMKLRIYDKSGKYYYSPVKFILYTLLRASTKKIAVSDMLSLAQQITPYHQGMNIREVVDLFLNDGLEEALMYIEGFINSKNSKTINQNYRLGYDEFESLYTNRKSKSAVQVYYLFYNNLWDYLKNKTDENLQNLIEIFEDKKQRLMLNKAFGFNKKIFVIPRKKSVTTVEKFEELNYENSLLHFTSINEFNKLIYSRFIKSKYEDKKGENTSETKKLLEATGLFRTENNIIEVKVKELFNIDKIEEKLLDDILVDNKKDESFEEYEGINGKFGGLTNFLNIVGVNENTALKALKTIKNKYGFDSTSDLSRFYEENEDHEFKKFISNKFPRKKVFTILSMFSDRSNDRKIQKEVTDEADIPTIFEYIVGLAWYYLSDDKSYVLQNSYNLFLNSNYLPVGHAPGGNGDIVINYSSRTLMLEVTLMNKHAQKRGEWEPVLRHSVNLSITNKNPSMTIFVADELDSNTINIWRAVASVPLESSKEAGKYTKENVEIMPVKISDFLKFNDEKNFSSEKFLRAVKKSFDEMRKIPFEKNWRENIIQSSIQ